MIPLNSPIQVDTEAEKQRRRDLNKMKSSLPKQCSHTPAASEVLNPGIR